MDELLPIVRRMAAPARRMRGPASLSEDVIRAMRAAADPVDFATEQRRLDKLMGRDVYEGPSFEGVDVPDDDISAMVAATGAPRLMLERGRFEAPLVAAMRDDEVNPLIDMLRTAERSRALVDSRLGRLTPEQRASSLQVVGRQAEADAAADAAGLRAARRSRGSAMEDAAAFAGLTGLGLGAAAIRRAAETDPPEDPYREMVDQLMAEQVPLDIPEPYIPEFPDREIHGSELLAEAADIMHALSPLSPDEAIESAPGPESQVTAPSSAIEILVSRGVPRSRAADIAGGSPMTPDEFRILRGGQ